MPNQGNSAPATKSDLRAFARAIREDLKDFATKEDLEHAQMEMAELLDTAINAQTDTLESRFEFIAEHYFHEISGANKDEREMIKDKLQNHERRIQVLEVK